MKTKNKEKNLVVIGNGLYKALGWKSDFSDVVDYFYGKMFKKLEEKLLNRSEINDLNNFIEEYSRRYMMGGDEWNCFEEKLIEFFEETKTKSFEKLKRGFILFSWICQHYFINYSGSSHKNYPSLTKKISDFVNKENIITLSLNYADYNNNTKKINSSFKNFYYLHFMDKILPFVDFTIWLNELPALKKDKTHKDLNNQFHTFSNYDKLFVNENTDKKLKTYRKVSGKLTCKYGIAKTRKPIKKKLLFSILGTSEKIEKSELKFLSKNESDFLITKNYPGGILKDINKKNKNFKFIYFFGYSFGKSDTALNKWLKEQNNNFSNWKFIFFEKDKDDSDLLSSNLNKFNEISNLNLEKDKFIKEHCNFI